MIEYNKKNCRELAEYVVNSMDMDTLVSFAIDQLIGWYDSDEENFRDDVESSGFGVDEEDDEDQEDQEDQEDDNEEKYVIISESERAFWSNEYGWVDFFDATRFEEVNVRKYQLPIGGDWIKYKDVSFDAKCWNKEDEDE